MKVGIKQMARTFLAAVARCVARWLQRETVMASKSAVEFRLGGCSKCPHYNHETEMCTLCNCFVAIKTLLAGERCPDNPPRWGPVF